MLWNTNGKPTVENDTHGRLSNLCYYLRNMIFTIASPLNMTQGSSLSGAMVRLMIRYPRVFLPDLWPSGKTKSRLSKTWKLRCFKQHNSGYRVPIKLKTGYCIWMGYHENWLYESEFLQNKGNPFHPVRPRFPSEICQGHPGLSEMAGHSGSHWMSQPKI